MNFPCKFVSDKIKTFVFKALIVLWFALIVMVEPGCWVTNKEKHVAGIFEDF